MDTGGKAYLRVHVNEAVSTSGGKGGSADHPAVMEMVMVLQSSDLQNKQPWKTAWEITVTHLRKPWNELLSDSFGGQKLHLGGSYPTQKEPISTQTPV